jgi:DnaJ-class molecular chaperone
MFPSWRTADCPTCDGSGEVLSVHAPGWFSGRAETYYPDEDIWRCPDCLGTGRLEVCAECGSAPVIRDGLETCRCPAVPLRQAA